MKNLFKSILILSGVASLSAMGGTYTTTFPLNENPISESGAWINGGVVGLDWSNCATASGFVYGAQTGAGTGIAQYTDSTALLAGTWGPTQTVSAVVKVWNQAPATVGQEVELRLLSNLSAHSSTGYEITYSVCAADPYTGIARWDGELGVYSIMATENSHYARDGDTVTAVASNGVIYLYINGSLILQASDSTYTNGNPGIGFFLDNNNGTSSPGNSTDFGFTSFTASDSISHHHHHR